MRPRISEKRTAVKAGPKLREFGEQSESKKSRMREAEMILKMRDLKDQVSESLSGENFKVF